MTLPALRYVDLYPVEQSGQTLFCISDPEGIVEDRLVLAPAAAFVAMQLNGLNEVADIQGAFKAQFNGTEVPEEFIHQVVEELDGQGFMMTPAFDALCAEIETAFTSSDIRSSSLAGKSYPANRDELVEFLDQQFTRENAPGAVLNGEPGKGEPLPGLIVPHIDMHRGGHAYAHAYKALYESGKPDTIVIFGVAHATEPVPFILTRKQFETPLGTVQTDTDMVDALAEACTWDPFAHEMTHRTEHSIEFQALMLAHIYGPDVKIVPILVSHFGDNPDFDDSEALKPIDDFLVACRDYIRSSDKHVTVLASVDLAHVGKRFGDSYDIDDGVIQSVTDRDTQDLEHVDSVTPCEFYRSVMQDGNERRVCGLNAIYATLKCLEGIAGKGERLHYDYAHDPAGGIVSFASYALHRS